VIHSSAWWTIESAGWAVDESEDHTAFVPCDTAEEAALIIGAFRKSDGAIAPEELWEMSGKASPPSAGRESVKCGPFEGYRTRYDAEDSLHWRVWWLAQGSLHLYVTFNCQRDDAGKHDMVLDWMLSTLKVVPFAG
jgi:hypothetical protein